MNNQSIRRLYLIGIILAAILFVTMIIDHYANDAAWITPLAIIFGILALILIILLLLHPGSKAEPVIDHVDYVGDVHEVVDLEGIGPTYAAKLKAMHIDNTQQLLFTPTDLLVQGTGAPAKTVENWKSMSQLIKVRGIGPQYAEALVRAGVDGIEELRDEPAAAIAGGVQGYLDSLDGKVIGQKLTTKRVQTWQATARKMVKEHIDLGAIKVMPLESKAAKAGASA